MPEFIEAFRGLPEEVRELARKNYRLWAQDHRHPSLHFKRVGRSEPVYSVRIGIGYRALALVEDDTAYWYWIGTHAEYDRIIATF